MAVWKAKKTGLHELIADMIGAKREGRDLTADEERQIRTGARCLRSELLEEEAQDLLAHIKKIQSSNTTGSG
jgi:hypothetical protein